MEVSCPHGKRPAIMNCSWKEDEPAAKRLRCENCVTPVVFGGHSRDGLPGNTRQSCGEHNVDSCLCISHGSSLPQTHGDTSMREAICEQQEKKPESDSGGSDRTNTEILTQGFRNKQIACNVVDTVPSVRPSFDSEFDENKHMIGNRINANISTQESCREPDTCNVVETVPCSSAVPRSPHVSSSSSVRTALSSESDDPLDASDLVLSVIKTKVDLQTMKMCLRRNSGSFQSSVRPGSSVGASTSGSPTSSSQRQSGHNRSHSIPIRTLTPLQDGDVQASGGHSNLSQPVEYTESSQDGLVFSSLLDHWQGQHTAKAIVDNAINRTIEEMVVVSDHSIVDDSTFEQSSRTLHDRLQPVINQLTQASELVFARSIEHSRSNPADAASHQ